MWPKAKFDQLEHSFMLPGNEYQTPIMQVWEGYVPAAETATASGSEEEANGHASSDSPRETVTVTVTEVVSGSEFYVQVLHVVVTDHALTCMSCWLSLQLCNKEGASESCSWRC